MEALKPPHIPLEVVEWLLQAYPERPSYPSDSHEKLLHQGAQRGVVLHLKRLLEEQRQAALTGSEDE